MSLLRPIACSILLIGGCSEREESGCLRSIEEVSLSRTPTGVNVVSQVVGQLQEARRSPSVFRERNGFVVLGGEVEFRSVLRLFEYSLLIWDFSLFLVYSFGKFLVFQNSLGAVIGGYNGTECLKTVQLLSSTTLHDIPFRLKNSVGVTLTDGAVLLFGGWDEIRTMKTNIILRLNFNPCFTSYRIELESILPYDVEGHCCARYGDHVFVIGGYDGVSVTEKIVRYSISNKSSEVLPTHLSIARENHVCEILLDRYLVIMAGWDGKKALNSIEVFELTDEYPYLIPFGVEFKLSEARIRPASIVVY
ncbi:unnamed protein product [Angiostrongylus costaricensis]|uniref:Kelch repeat protein n=1 Tax=Angiostrongylus costaricensis TaxID=334426 RepID=A0A158PGK2_ANGCS|nr:unnamed protein product [Angiostrongylus costaricensis]